MRSAVVLLALFVGGCGAGAGITPTKVTISQPFILQKEQEDAVKRAVLAKLKDPESARFGGIKAGLTSTGKVLGCGLVNAKNSFGGYVGMKTYALEIVGQSITIHGPSDLIVELCEYQGLLPKI